MDHQKANNRQTNIQTTGFIDFLRNTAAFTLVELIVVITVLAILGTVGFISLQGYSLKSRDATRISNMQTVVSGLNVWVAKGTTYPMPDGQISTGSISGIDNHL